MLVISRKEDQGVVIGDAVVRVLAIERGRVKLGIAAPEDVRVRRDELPERDGAK